MDILSQIVGYSIGIALAIAPHVYIAIRQNLEFKAEIEYMRTQTLKMLKMYEKGC